MGRAALIALKSILLATALLGESRMAWAYDVGYGGRLTTPDGAPVAGPLNLVFHFYRSETNPTPTLTLAKSAVPVVDGMFQVSLSLSADQLDSLMGDGSEKIYIEVEALGRRYPKQVFSYVPLALRVPVDDDSIIFSNGRLAVGSISASQVQGLSAALAAKADATSLTAGLLGKANSSHNHTTADITDLATVLSTKANTNAPLTGDVTGTLTGSIVSSIRGAGIPAPNPSTDSNKFVQYNGSSFVYTAIASSSGGTVTNVSATTPLSVSNGTTVPVLAISQASPFASGYLSAGDFSTFNSKQDAISTASTLGTGTVTTAQQRGLELKPYGTGTGEVRFAELAANGTNYVGFKAPDALTADKVWTLPTTDGAPGQVLKTDGQGNLSWAAGLSPADGASTNTPSSIVMRDGSGNFTAGTITASFVGNVTGNVLGNVTGTAANVTGTVSVANGGTGLTSGTAGGLPYFSTSSSLASTAALGDGQLLIGSAAGAPVPATLTQGATAGVTIASGAGSIALDTAQDIRSTSSPTFAGLSLGNGSLAAGTITVPILVAGSQDASSTAGIGLVRGADATGEDVTGPDLSIAAGNGTGTGGSGNIQFLTAAAGEAGSTAGTMVPRVSIDKSGNVGIGTTAPRGQFDVAGPGDIWLAYDSIIGSNQSLIAPGHIFFTPYDSTGIVYLQARRTDDSGSTSMRFRTSDAGALRDAMHINSKGNVGIGTTSPTNLLSVNGSANVTGNVGIGSTAPIQLLDVAGVIRSSSGGFMFPDGSMMSSALPTPSSGYSSTTDLNMAADFGGNGTGNLMMSTRGTERLRITNAGNIGIGSTAPGSKMDVVAGAAATGLRVLSGSASNWTGYALGRTTTEATLGIAAGANSLTTGSLAGDIVLRSETSSQRLMFSNGTGSPSMTVGNGGVVVSGSLGVGIDAPSQPLEVLGIIKSSAGGFMFPDGSIMTSAATPGTSGTSSTTDLNLIADSAAAGTGDAIVSTKGAERMRVSNAGNIGIGTSAPGDKLMIRSTKDSTVSPQLPGLAVVDSSLANQGVGGGIALWGNYTGTTPISGATIHAMKNSATAGDTGFNLAFNTRVNGGGLTEKMRITSAGNVGIGTVSPSGMLDIRASGNGAVGSYLRNSSSGTNAYTVMLLGNDTASNKLVFFTNSSTRTTDGGAGNSTIRTDSGNLHLSAAGGQKVTLQTDGNVGIGTTAPTRALDVNGVVRASGGFMFPDGTMMTTAATSSSSSSGGSTSSETNLTLAADTGATGTGVVAINTAGVERMRVANDGNVGIGTTMPTSKLSVDGNATFTGGVDVSSSNPGSTNLMRLFNTATTDSNSHAIFYVSTSAGGGNPLISLGLQGITNWYFAADRSADGALKIGRTGASPAAGLGDLVTISRGGNVGIGTTSPNNLLDLSRGSSGSSTDQLILRNGSTSTTTLSTGAGLAFALTNASTARHAAISAVVSNAASGATDLILSTLNTGTSATEKVRIQAGGFVGLGTTSPANRLSVAGGADFSGNVGIGSNIPARALDVVGVVRASAGIEFPDGTTMTTASAVGTGTSSATDLSFAADSDADGSGVISFATRGSERIRVENTGNIGFGTPTPLSRVAINGGLSVGAYAGATPAAAPSNSMIISGNIGIGLASPGYKLDVLTSGAGMQTASRMWNNVTAANNSGAQTVYSANRTTNGVTDLAAVGGIITDITAGAYKGALILSTANNSAPAERMRIDSSGNVGIGTNSPANRLSVNGTANITGNVGIGTTTASQPLEVAGSIKLSSAGSLIFPDGTSMSTAAAASTGSSSATDLVFSADSDGDGSGILTMATSGTERMRLDSNGNVGIGTTAPTARLTLQTTSSLDGINLVSGASSSSPAYSLYDGATERGVFGLATAAAQRSNSAAAGDIVLRATSGKLLLQTGTADATMVLSNGNVGIGTTNPGALLDVSGARFGAPTLTGAYLGLAGPTLTDNVTAASATATNMAFHAIASPTLAASNSSVTTTNAYTAYIGGAPKKGTFNTVTNAVALGIGAAAVTGQTNSYGLFANAQTGATNNYAAVFQGGNVGIGSAAPISRLDVAGVIRSSSGGFVFPDGSVMTTAITPTTGGTSSTTDLNLAADTEGTGSGAVIVSTGTVERMRVVNSGNVGIGTSTPVNTLSVNGTANFTGNVGIGTTTPAAKLDVDGSIVIPGFESGGASVLSFRRAFPAANNVGIRTKAITTANYDGMEIVGHNGIDFTVNSGTVVAQRIAANGNVGIGTTAPAARLDVTGDMLLNGVLHLRGGILQAPFWSTLSLDLRNNDAQDSIEFRYSAANTGTVDTIGMTMKGNGNIGIGTPSPGSRLQVNGNAAIGYNTATAGPANGLAISGNLGIGSTAPGYKLDVVGDINTTTCVRIAGTQQVGTCASDERFKKNITPITGALAKLRLLSPVHYEFRTDEFPSRNFSQEVEAGLIAQELERVFPHLVVTDDDGYKRVRYGLDLNMQTIAAVKELALENDQLRARVDRAESEVSQLKAEARAMRAFLCGEFPSAPMCAP